MTIHLFLSDPLFANPRERIDYRMLVDTGYFDNVLESCHATPVFVRDHRNTRLAIEYREENFTPVDTTMFISDPIADNWSSESRHGIMVESIIAESAEYRNSIDMSHLGQNLPSGPTTSNVDNAALIFDADKASTDQRTYFSGLTDSDYESLFNIIEYLSAGTVSSDTITEINDVLTTGSDGSFKGYQDKTIVISPLRDTAAINGLTSPGQSIIHRMVPRWFEFDFFSNISGNMRVRIWLNTKYYRDNYPYYDIIEVLPPFDTDKLINPGSLGPSIDELIHDSEQDAEILKDAIKDNNQTGVVVTKTRFEWNDTSRQVTFTLVYRGRVPTIIEQKNAIADYLLGLGTGVTVWNGLLPDIFIANNYFLIPLYHNVKTHQTGGKYYPSICYPQEAINVMSGLTGGIDTVSNPHRSIITIAYNKLFVGVFGNDDNDTPDVIDLHPTYRDFSSTDAGFIELSTDTRDFSIKLNQGVAAAMGENNDFDYTMSRIGGYDFVTFTHGDASFNIMTQEHYLQYFEQLSK